MTDALPLVYSAVLLPAAGGLLAWAFSTGWKRWKRGEEASIAAQHDMTEFQQSLTTIADAQIRRTFEVQGLLLNKVLESHSECERRLLALETDRNSRVGRLAAAEQRIAVLEKIMRDAGVPIPPME